VGVAREIVYPSKIWPINREATLRAVVVVDGCPSLSMDAQIDIILDMTAANDRVRNRRIDEKMCGHTLSSLKLVGA
jgi:hypothetical protein